MENPGIDPSTSRMKKKKVEEMGKEKSGEKKSVSGESGHRSRYLSHAKRALYHVS